MTRKQAERIAEVKAFLAVEEYFCSSEALRRSKELLSWTLDELVKLRIAAIEAEREETGYYKRCGVCNKDVWSKAPYCHHCTGEYP